MGRYGVIQVYNREYECTGYSMVSYVEQISEYRDFVDEVVQNEKASRDREKIY